MNKFNKAKTIGLISASLAGVSLMGVGFAAWVVNGSQEATTGNIQVEVGEVIDNRISITDASVASGQGGIKFDAVAPSSTIAGALLTAQTGSSENLSFTLNYKVNNFNDSNGFTVKAYIKVAENKTLPDFSTAVTRRYIEMPKNLGLSQDDAVIALTKGAGASQTASVTSEVNGTDGVYTVSQTFTFSWGEAFGKVNPCNLTAESDIYNYESNSVNKTEKATQDVVIKHLEDLKTLVNSTDGFTVVLVPEVTTAVA